MSVKLSLMLPPEPDEAWDLAQQIGITHASTRLPKVSHWRGTETEDMTSDTKPWDFEPILHMQQSFEDAGFELAVLEDIFPPLEDVRLGTDIEGGIEEMKRLVRNMGAVGIPVLCYSWTAVFNWFRTSVTVPARGGSLTSRYDSAMIENAPPTRVGRVHADDLWENLETFLNEIIPVAEEAGVKLAMHPADPPLPTVRGVDRLMTNPEAFDRLVDLYPSDHNGIAFCQGNFTAMGTDIPEMVDHFADHINYVHFRDIEGTTEHFTETWHDAGPTDMLETMEAYYDIGYDGPMRPDHVPTMAGESNDNPGYEMKGRLFAVGYIRGLMDAAERSV